MLVSISEVKQRRARLGLGWVTVLRKRSRYLQTFHKWKRSLLVPAGAGPETIIAELRYTTLVVVAASCSRNDYCLYNRIQVQEQQQEQEQVAGACSENSTLTGKRC
jgi:hypothetical protein